MTNDWIGRSALLSVEASCRNLRQVLPEFPVSSAHVSVCLSGLSGTRLSLPHDAGSSDAGRAVRSTVGKQSPVDSRGRLLHSHPRFPYIGHHSGNVSLIAFFVYEETHLIVLSIFTVAADHVPRRKHQRPRFGRRRSSLGVERRHGRRFRRNEWIRRHLYVHRPLDGS